MLIHLALRLMPRTVRTLFGRCFLRFLVFANHVAWETLLPTPENYAQQTGSDVDAGFSSSSPPTCLRFNPRSLRRGIIVIPAI